MSWTLCYQGTEKPLHEWCIGRLTRRTLNQGIDMVRFCDLSASIDTSLHFAPEHTVIIAYKNQRWFHGLVTKTPTTGKFNQEERIYELSGPWWYLEHLVYQQKWQYITAQTESGIQTCSAEKGRIILGQDENGNRITAEQQIRLIGQYAIDQGALFQIGNLQGLDFYFPFDEIKDISCAEAIQRVLRWVPDAIVWFEYSASPLPQLNCVRRVQRKTFSLELNQLQEIEINPRHDLQVRSVVIKYEYSHTENGHIWKQLAVDRYPENATGREFKSLVFTLELDGAKVHTHRQNVKTTPLDVENISWWQNHLPVLRNSGISNLTLKNVRRETSLPNELIEGAVSKWMNRTVATETIRAQIGYQDAHGNVVTREVAVRIRTTDAVSKTYERSTVDSISTPLTTGLAKIFYDATAPLQYEGKCSWLLEEAFLAENILAKALIINSGPSEFGSMNAPIQEVREDIDKGIINLRFGPPKHLGPDDLIQLLRSNRIRTIPGTIPIRCNLSTTPSSGYVTEFPDVTPFESVHVETDKYEKMVVKGQNGQLVLDANEIQSNKTVRLREYKIVDSGVLKSALLLSSEGY